MTVIPAHKIYYNRLNDHQKKLVKNFFKKVEKVLLPEDSNLFEITSKINPQLSNKENREVMGKLKRYFESLGYEVTILPDNIYMHVKLPIQHT